MDNDRILLDQEMKKASDKVNNTYKTLAEVEREGMKESGDFYFRIALMAAGILSLSVTYIGFLASLHRQFILSEILILGWASLLICLFASVYRNHFHANFIHWQILKKYVESRSNEEKVSIKFLQAYPDSMIGEGGPEKMITVSKENLAKYKAAHDHNEKKEKLNESLWLLMQNSAHFSFVLGVTSIVLFAAINLPVQYNLLGEISKLVPKIK